MVFLSQRGIISLTLGSFFLSLWGGFSLTELTDFTEPFCTLFNSWGVFSLTELTDLTELVAHCFELTERLRHTDITEAFQLRLAVTFCEIG